jgi:hypothetical protein
VGDLGGFLIMAKIILNSGMENPDLISNKTLGILSKAGDNSKNPTVTVTSGIRSPRRQATAMYDNLSKGVRVSYAAPGREVTAVYDNNKSKAKETVIALMTAKINELATKGQKTSLHCVPESEYRKLNIVDITKNLPNPRDFVKELIKEDAVTRVITPFASDCNSKKISVDTAEPAIHVEVRV